MFLEILRTILYIVLSASALILILVICLQEGKGGGLAAAFGGAGGEAFGVGSGGINRFTATLAAVFIGSAIILAATAPDSVAGGSDESPAKTAPEGAGDEGAGGGGEKTTGQPGGDEKPDKPGGDNSPDKPK